MTLFQGFHDFIYIDDFVRGIDTLVKATDAPRGDIVNFGSGEQYSNFVVYELFKYATGLSGSSVKVEERMAKSFESATWVCDIGYAEKAYNFKTKYSLEQGIKEFVTTAQY
jgi:nucleoside-diphosphate-sugar epimerase